MSIVVASVSEGSFTKELGYLKKCFFFFSLKIMSFVVQLVVAIS
jgi:hypothetical protein